MKNLYKLFTPIVLGWAFALLVIQPAIADEYNYSVKPFAGIANALGNALNQLTSGIHTTVDNAANSSQGDLNLPGPSWSPTTALATGERHVLYVTKDGVLWGWGSNGVGQLGGEPSIRSILLTWHRFKIIMQQKSGGRPS